MREAIALRVSGEALFNVCLDQIVNEELGVIGLLLFLGEQPRNSALPKLDPRQIG